MDLSCNRNGELIQYTVRCTSGNTNHRSVSTTAQSAETWYSLLTHAANANHMSQLARQPLTRDVNCEAIGLTLRTLFLSVATDVYGNVPCSEAFQGQAYYDEENSYITFTNFKPVFDTQQEVYTQLFKTLETANSTYALDRGIKLNARDLMYGGDVLKWKKLNNSLYLRLLMRLSNRNNEKLAPSMDGVRTLTPFEKMREIVSSPGVYPIFESNDDNATVRFSGESPNENRYGRSLDSYFTARKACEQLLMMMESKGTIGEEGPQPQRQDPRTSSFFQISGLNWNGAVSGSGLEEEGGVSGAAYLNRDVLGTYTAPYSFMKYDELLFILSEAAFRGVALPRQAKDYYEEAVRSSCHAWIDMNPNKPWSENEIDNFILAYANFELGLEFPSGSGSRPTYTTAQQLENLLNQKYIALFWVGYEAWCDYRRTGYPTLTINSGTQNDHVLPTRMEYPVNVRSTNPANYEAAVNLMRERYGQSDNMKCPVWWSRQAAAIDGLVNTGEE
ncbi:MAG: SusD/RagB family nutrient-binding outer membrane lipoprotein, partial [Prevotellaceae bacterium]|jgi:hypothetical protein|nr:SusD/RagB family nutrient-binding outer membrane lipoprotein [Prevotellaceae bacterium]